MILEGQTDLGDRYADRYRHIVFERMAPQELPASLPLPRVVRRSRHIEYHLRTHLYQFGHYLGLVGTVPEVLADGDAELHAFPTGQYPRGGGLEIADLVEDIISGQQCLGDIPHKLAVFDDGGRITQLVLRALDAAEEYG